MRENEREHMTDNKRWEEMIGPQRDAQADAHAHMIRMKDMGIVKDCPSLQEELKQETDGYLDYDTYLKDYTHEQLVQMIKQMDISAKGVGKHVQNKTVMEQDLIRALETMHREKMLIKAALRDLIEYADVGLYNRDEMDMDDE